MAAPERLVQLAALRAEMWGVEPPANVRANKLLRAYLGEKDYLRLREGHGIRIKSQRNRTYRIVWGSGTVYRMGRFRKNKITAGICCYSPGVPLGDLHLSQILHLKHNEDEFLRIGIDYL